MMVSQAQSIRWLILVLAVTAHQVAVAEDDGSAATKPPANEFIERLRDNKKRLEESQEKTKQLHAKHDIPYNPDLSLNRRYEFEIQKAEKIVAAGGEYGKTEYQAASKAILEEGRKLRERAVQRSKTMSETIRDRNEQFDRTVAEARKKYDAVMAESEKTYRQKIAFIDLSEKFRKNAGKIGIVIWNLPLGSDLHDRSTVIANIQLLRDDEVVWTRKALRLTRKVPNNPVRVPNVMFDKVRVEVARWTGVGGGLAEVQVFLGKENVALARPCEVSSVETLPMHLDDVNALTDGIIKPVKVGEGYWIPEEKTKASVTVNLLGTPDESVLNAIRLRP